MSAYYINKALLNLGDLCHHLTYFYFRNLRREPRHGVTALPSVLDLSALHIETQAKVTP
jgi:hypothetical protein